MEQGNRGEGARENRGQERDLSERESGSAFIKKFHDSPGGCQLLDQYNFMM